MNPQQTQIPNFSWYQNQNGEIIPQDSMIQPTFQSTEIQPQLLSTNIPIQGTASSDIGKTIDINGMQGGNNQFVEGNAIGILNDPSGNPIGVVNEIHPQQGTQSTSAIPSTSTTAVVPNTSTTSSTITPSSSTTTPSSSTTTTSTSAIPSTSTTAVVPNTSTTSTQPPKKEVDMKNANPFNIPTPHDIQGTSSIPPTSATTSETPVAASTTTTSTPTSTTQKTTTATPSGVTTSQTTQKKEGKLKSKFHHLMDKLHHKKTDPTHPQPVLTPTPNSTNPTVTTTTDTTSPDPAKSW